MTYTTGNPHYEVMVDALESMAAIYLMQDVPGLGEVLINDYTSTVELCLACLLALGHIAPVGPGDMYFRLTEKSFWRGGRPTPDLPEPPPI